MSHFCEEFRNFKANPIWEVKGYFICRYSYESNNFIHILDKRSVVYGSFTRTFFSQMSRNEIMGGKKISRKTSGRGIQKFEFALLYFIHSALCRSYVIIYVTFSSDRRLSATVLFLINATRFPYLPSVTTIILPTSLRSLCREEKYSTREVSTSVFVPFFCYAFCAFVFDIINIYFSSLSTQIFIPKLSRRFKL